MAGDVGISIKDEAITRARLHDTAMYTATGELSLQHAVPLYKDVTLTAAQLDALNATPITCIAAPGAGKVIVVDQVYGFLDYNSAAYAGTSETLAIRYTDGSGDIICQFTEATFIEATADAYEIPAMIQVFPVVNSPVVAHATADFTTGDSPIYLRIYYRILTAAVNGTP